MAKENLESARNSLQHTDRMHRKGYVTALQRDAQAFAVQRSKLDLEVAETAINVLEKFTKPRRWWAWKVRATRPRPKWPPRRRPSSWKKTGSSGCEAQLEKCAITAPGRRAWSCMPTTRAARRGSGAQSVIEEGAMVRERQTIIRLPDLSHMQVKCTVHESKIDSLQRGMRARINIQDREFQGIVTSVANQPEPATGFRATSRNTPPIVTHRQRSARACGRA